MLAPAFILCVTEFFALFWRFGIFWLAEFFSGATGPLQWEPTPEIARHPGPFLVAKVESLSVGGL